MARKINLDERAQTQGYKNFDHMARVVLREQYKSVEHLARLLNVARETVASRTRGMSVSNRKADAMARSKGYENMRMLVLDKSTWTNEQIKAFAGVSVRTIQNYRKRSGKAHVIADPVLEKPKQVFISEIDRDIMLDMAHGLKYAEIGRVRGLSESAIKARISKLMYKFEVQTNIHLISLCISSDVIRTQDLFRHFDVHVTEYRKGKQPTNFVRLDEIRMRQ